MRYHCVCRDICFVLVHITSTSCGLRGRPAAGPQFERLDSSYILDSTHRSLSDQPTATLQNGYTKFKILDSAVEGVVESKSPAGGAQAEKRVLEANLRRTFDIWSVMKLEEALCRANLYVDMVSSGADH